MMEETKMMNKSDNTVNPIAETTTPTTPTPTPTTTTEENHKSLFQGITEVTTEKVGQLKEMVEHVTLEALHTIQDTLTGITVAAGFSEADYEETSELSSGENKEKMEGGEKENAEKQQPEPAHPTVAESVREKVMHTYEDAKDKVFSTFEGVKGKAIDMYEGVLERVEQLTEGLPTGGDSSTKWGKKGGLDVDELDHILETTFIPPLTPSTPTFIHNPNIQPEAVTSKNIQEIRVEAAPQEKIIEDTKLAPLNPLTPTIRERTTDTVTRVVEDAKDKVGEIYEGAKEKTGELLEVAKEKAGEIYEGAKEKTGQLYEGAKENVNWAAEKTKEKVGDLYEENKRQPDEEVDMNRTAEREGLSYKEALFSNQQPLIGKTSSGRVYYSPATVDRKQQQQQQQQQQPIKTKKGAQAREPEQQSVVDQSV